MTRVSMKAAFPGKYVQGPGASADVGRYITQFGQRGLVLATQSAFTSCIPALRATLPQGTRVEPFNGECSEKELARIGALIREHRIDVVVGIGGGKVIDTAKITADRNGCRVIVMPTIASTDAPCSGCAIVYTDDGVFESVFYQKNNPDVVIVDSQIVALAPARFLVSGMGDALSTWFEARSCQRSQSPNECGGQGTISSYALSELCYKTLMRYGRAAKLACEQHVVTPALERIIEANTLLSGLGFESSGLAAAHAIHNGLTALHGTHGCFHGEKVAFGTVTGLHLTDADPDEIDAVYAFCEDVGLPTTFDGIGLSGVSRDDLMRVAERSCDAKESIHKEAGCMTPGRVLDALIAADAFGRARRNA